MLQDKWESIIGNLQLLGNWGNGEQLSQIKNMISVSMNNALYAYV